MVADKSVANATEAMVGAYLLVGGSIGARRFLHWLGIKEIKGCFGLGNLLPFFNQFAVWQPLSPGVRPIYLCLTIILQS